MPPNVIDAENPEELAKYLETLDLKKLVKETGGYAVYPETTVTSVVATYRNTNNSHILFKVSPIAALWAQG